MNFLRKLGDAVFTIIVMCAIGAMLYFFGAPLLAVMRL